MTKRICRLCLTHTTVCYSLLEENISVMLEALTSIRVTPGDNNVPTLTCTKCLLNMKLAFNIQQNFLKADEKLREMTLLNNVEPAVSDTQFKEETPIELREINLGKCNTNCIICGVTVDENLLTRHVQDHFEEKQVCDLCDKSFSNIEECKCECIHFNNKCETCGATFRYRSLYNIHTNRAHTRFKVPHNLKSNKAVMEIEDGEMASDECLKRFNCKRQFQHHTHQKKKCPICNAEITKNNIKKHIMNHTSGPQICKLCGATLRNMESLRGHIHYTHSTAVYNCDECDKVFNKRYTYLMHKKKHAGEKSHVCETCGKSFFRFYHLSKHIKTTHLKLRPFICQYCSKAFSCKSALKTHIRQHTNETPYKCEICGDGFRQNVSLRAHRKSKHNIVEAKTCACSVCGKAFGSEQAIASHMRLH